MLVLVRKLEKFNLVGAHNKRGVHVEILLDQKMNARRQRLEACYAEVLTQAGIVTKIDARHPDAHNNIIIIDAHL